MDDVKMEQLRTLSLNQWSLEEFPTLITWAVFHRIFVVLNICAPEYLCSWIFALLNICTPEYLYPWIFAALHLLLMDHSRCVLGDSASQDLQTTAESWFHPCHKSLYQLHLCPFSFLFLVWNCALQTLFLPVTPLLCRFPADSRCPGHWEVLQWLWPGRGWQLAEVHPSVLLLRRAEPGCVPHQRAGKNLPAGLLGSPGTQHWQHPGEFGPGMDQPWEKLKIKKKKSRFMVLSPAQHPALMLIRMLIRDSVPWL